VYADACWDGAINVRGDIREQQQALRTYLVQKGIKAKGTQAPGPDAKTRAFLKKKLGGGIGGKTGNVSGRQAPKMASDKKFRPINEDVAEHLNALSSLGLD